MSNKIAAFLRAFSRILLSLGALISLGLAILLIFPLLSNSEQTTISTESQHLTPEHENSQVNPSSKSPFLEATIFITSIFIAIGLLFICLRGLKHYNNFLRKIIQKIANSLKLPIHAIELLLSTIVWTAVCLLCLFFSPLISVFLLFALILNLLTFTIAWCLYGQPRYVI